MASVLGLLTLGLGLIYAVYILSSVIAGKTIEPGWTGLIMTVLVLGGVQLLCLGIIAEYIGQIVEKPAPENAPSNLGVVGRYILPAEIFTLLESVRAGVGGEIQLTDAISRQLETKPLLAHAFDGVRYDCGSRHGFIRATVDFALEHADLREDLLSYFETVRK